MKCTFWLQVLKAVLASLTVQIFHRDPYFTQVRKHIEGLLAAGIHSFHKVDLHLMSPSHHYINMDSHTNCKQQRTCVENETIKWTLWKEVSH